MSYRPDPQRDLRVLERAEIGSGCWTYDGAVAGGYHVAKVGGQMVRVHRHLYALLRGPVPAGMQLHHACENKLCVNPWHLEPLAPADHAAKHLLKACPQGHSYSGDNLYINPQGFRECRACHRKRKRDDYRRRNGIPLDQMVRGGGS